MVRLFPCLGITLSTRIIGSMLVSLWHGHFLWVDEVSFLGCLGERVRMFMSFLCPFAKVALHGNTNIVSA